MVAIKSCPFCDCIPKLQFNTCNNKYYLQCDNCSKYGIILRCEQDTIEDTVRIWNKRWFDDKLLLDKGEYQKFIDAYYYNQKIISNPDKRDRKLEVKLCLTSEWQGNQENYGCLIFEDGEIVSCDLYGHPEILMQRYNIMGDSADFDHVKFCAEHKIVRITIYNSYLSIDIPLEYTKKQINAIFEAFLYYECIPKMTKFSIFFYKTKSLRVFYTADELLEVLDAQK